MLLVVLKGLHVQLAEVHWTGDGRVIYHRPTSFWEGEGVGSNTL